MARKYTMRVCLVLVTCVVSVTCCDSSLLSSASDTHVKCIKTPAVLGGNVTLTCSLLQPGEAIQKTWCMINGNESKVLATDSEFGPDVKPEFSSYISVLPLDSDQDRKRSSIEISKLENEDEACYICSFHMKHDDVVHGVICLRDIGTSNEFTCSAPGKLLNILMSPQEIKTRKSKRDDIESRDGNLLLKGRYLNSNVHPTCTFYLQKAKKRALRSKKKLREGTDEKVVLQCSVSGIEKPQIHWNNTGNVVGENNTTTVGQVTTITSSIQLLLSSLFSNQSVSCSIIDTTSGNPANIVICVVLALAVAVALAIFCICKRSSQKSEDKASKDKIQMENIAETSIAGIPENEDETPIKDVGMENYGLLTKANSYIPRKLFE